MNVQAPGATVVTVPLSVEALALVLVVPASGKPDCETFR